MTISTLKNAAKKIRKWFMLPLLILFFMFKQKNLIISDVRRWIELEFTEGIGHSDISNLLELISRYKEFRNVFYHRLFQGNSLDIVFAYIARKIYRESPLLLIPKSCNIGLGLFIQHGFFTGINADIGENCWINQQVLIGYKDKTGRPKLGNNVRVSAGATILGNITLGDNVTVGANALVIKDVPPNCVVGGVPAIIIRKNGLRVNEKL